jgi:hypothetical protein
MIKIQESKCLFHWNYWDDFDIENHLRAFTPEKINEKTFMRYSFFFLEKLHRHHIHIQQIFVSY